MLSRKRLFFQGVINVDDHDLAIVETYGKFVSELADAGIKLPFSLFEVYRENFQGKYWLPTYVSSDDYINDPNGGDQVHLRMVIRSTDFKLNPAPPAGPILRSCHRNSAEQKIQNPLPQRRRVRRERQCSERSIAPEQMTRQISNRLQQQFRLRRCATARPWGTARALRSPPRRHAAPSRYPPGHRRRRRILPPARRRFSARCKGAG